jgi:hypothetical protein
VLLSFLLLQSHSKRSSKIKSPWSVFSVTSSYVTVNEISTVLKEFINHIFYKPSTSCNQELNPNN